MRNTCKVKLAGLLFAAVLVGAVAVSATISGRQSRVEEDGFAEMTVDSAKQDSVTQSDAAVPEVSTAKTDDVQFMPYTPVTVINIPEAVAIADGDSDFFYSNEGYKDIIPIDANSFSATKLPAKYDSRDVNGKCYVTEVEDQGYTYLCWAYASIGAIESDILRHNEDISYTDIDLSEKHLAYYNVHRAEDIPDDGISDDYRELVNAEDEAGAWIFDYDSGYVAVGGVTDYCISLLTAWKGPVSERDNDAFEALYGQEYIFKDNTLAPSNAYNSEYHVQAVNEICASEENIKLVKQMIVEHGGVSIGVNADSVFWKDHNRTLYSHFESGEIPTANHEVLIIGWDDEFDASNFSLAPKKNGAWLCKNSWGKTSGDDGFFYLSYYDETVNNSNAAAYTSAVPFSEGWYDNNYQVAGQITNVVSTIDDSQNYAVALSTSRNPYGVLYEAEGEEYLNAIGLMAIDTYQQYKVNIYINPEEEDGKIAIKDASPTYSQKISAISGGFHTFELEKEIPLNAGDEFFVVIEPATEGRLLMEEEKDMVSEKNYDEWGNLTGNIHNLYTASNRSYYISDDGQSMQMQDDKDFFVKAYTTDKK